MVQVLYLRTLVLADDSGSMSGRVPAFPLIEVHIAASNLAVLDLGSHKWLHAAAWLPQLRSGLDTEGRCTARPGRLSLIRAAAQLDTRTAPGRALRHVLGVTGPARQQARNLAAHAYPTAEPG
jgi:hypothetical protein